MQPWEGITSALASQPADSHLTQNQFFPGLGGTCLCIWDPEGLWPQGNKCSWSFPGITLKKFSLREGLGRGCPALPTGLSRGQDRKRGAPDSHRGLSCLNTLERTFGVSGWPVRGQMFDIHRASQVAWVVKNPLVNAGDARDAVSVPGSGRSLEKDLTTHFISSPGESHGQRSLVR